MIRKNLKFLLGLIPALALFVGCTGDGGGGSSTEGSQKVRVHALSDLESLNIINSSDAMGTIVGYQTHQTLYMLNPKTYEYDPVVVKDMATVTTENDTVKITYEIREEAAWDDGTPITGEDVAFGLKLVLIPKTENKYILPYLDYIDDVVIDPENPKKFTLTCKRPYMQAAESLASNLWLFPPSVYDPEGILANYSVKDLSDETRKKEWEKDANLDKAAANFNSEKYNREIMSGSGPYKFEKWETNQRIVFKLKDNWWGHKVKNANTPWLQAYADEVSYVTIKDQTTAVVALKGESIDAMHAIPPKDFVTDLGKSDNFKEKYNLFTPEYFAYDYIGMNMRDERLGDVKVRKAFAHLMNVDQLIETEVYGLGERVTSFIHPSIKSRLNTDVKEIPFDIEQAKALLAEAGWVDSDKDGVVDKVIEGEKEDLSLTIHYNNGNDRRKTTCLLFQEAAKKAGVKIEIQPLDWSVMLDRMDKKDFDMYVGGWVASPTESDPGQIWHSESQNNGGSNYVGFGNEKSDAIIDELRQTVNYEKRAQLYKDLQAEIAEVQPYIFLLAQKNRVCIAKKYDGGFGTGLRSGLFPNGLRPVAQVTQ